MKEVLFVFVVLRHDRRELSHSSVTEHPLRADLARLTYQGSLVY